MTRTPKTKTPARATEKLIEFGRRKVDAQWLAERLMERPRTPPGRRGKMQVTVSIAPEGEFQTIVSHRNALFMGYAPCSCAFDVDLEIRELSFEGGVWMTDSPQEVWQMHDPLEALREMDEPELLVGGLGLGVFSRLAAEYAGAIVTTVEKDRRVIELVAEHAARRVEREDIYHYAKGIRTGDFDAAFLDTWQSTGEHCWVHEVVPLRRLIADAIPAPRIWCWNEEEMAGQVTLSGLQAMTVPLPQLPEPSIHWRVLRRAAERAGLVPDSGPLPKDVGERLAFVFDREQELADGGKASGILERFVQRPGSGPWEAEFGSDWDTSAREYRARERQRRREV